MELTLGLPGPSERTPLVTLGALEEWTSAHFSELRSRLAAVGYDARFIAEAERVAPRQLDAVRLPLVHAWLERRGGASSALAALFSYEAAVARPAVREALGEALTEALLEAGLLTESRDGIVARARLTPLEGLFLLSDGPCAGPEAVMGPGPTTVVLLNLIPRAPGDTLDVGCGAGTLALVAAQRGARRAVGVDLSPRAIALARLNARLNALPAAFEEGDLLEPVRGQRFDLVVSQPPYVPLPPGLVPTTYLHGGGQGDELALRFASAFPGALKEGGTALLHFDAPQLPERPLASRLREALGEEPLQVAVLTSPGPSPDLQAAAYGAVEDPSLGPAYRAAARAYRAHLERAGIASFWRAVVVLRRPAPGAAAFLAQVPVRLDRLEARELLPLLSGLEAAGQADAELLGTRVCLSPGARLVEEAPFSGAPGKLELRFDAGPATDQEMSEAARVLAEILRSPLAVQEAALAFAGACGATEEAVRPQVLAALREGLARGVYRPS